MYGNVIGPFAPGSSIYNRFAENKETITPRSGTKRVSYDKIKPYRPAVESRGVAKKAHVPAPEKPLGYNLFGQPQQQANPAAGQQFKPVPETSEGVLPATAPVDSAPIKTETAQVVPSEGGKYGQAGTGLGQLGRSFISGFGNLRSAITGYLQEEDGPVVKEEQEEPLRVPLNTRDDLIGSVPPDSARSSLFESATSQRSSLSESRASSRRSSLLTPSSEGGYLDRWVETVPIEDTGSVGYPSLPSVPKTSSSAKEFLRVTKAQQYLKNLNATKEVHLATNSDVEREMGPETRNRIAALYVSDKAIPGIKPRSSNSDQMDIDTPNLLERLQALKAKAESTGTRMSVDTLDLMKDVELADDINANGVTPSALFQNLKGSRKPEMRERRNVRSTPLLTEAIKETVTGLKAKAASKPIVGGSKVTVLREKGIEIGKSAIKAAKPAKKKRKPKKPNSDSSYVPSIKGR